MTEFDIVDPAVARKARGAFFTPPALCDFMVRWAVRSTADSVLEPSCGEAAFLLAAHVRLCELGARSPRLSGYEIHAPSAEAARVVLLEVGTVADIRVGDFLAEAAAPSFSAVVGNPPYVRYQSFSGDARANGLQAALAQGVRLTGLSSSWAPFVVHSAGHLEPGGRLAFVLPAELLSSTYAASVRSFLMETFSEVSVILVDSQVFPGVQTEAVILLADGKGGTTNSIKFARVRSPGDLTTVSFDITLQPERSTDRWTGSLVTSGATTIVDALRASGSFSPLREWGRVNLGAVTGNNKYFALSPARAEELGLGRNDVVRLSPPGSAHLRALTLSRTDYERLGHRDAKTLLFRPSTPTSAAWQYIAAGEAARVDGAYKCRIRKPWWLVPLPPVADMFFTYMNAHTPQLALNPLGLHHLNSVHGVYLNAHQRDHAANLALASLNSVTTLSAEFVGRAYGGGILKMEPGEAVALMVPSAELVARLAKPLSELRRPARRLLQAGQLSTVIGLVDELVLREGCGESESAVSHVRRDRNALANRRHGRRATTVEA
ncbi:HsdM family class I SAM-dependent methyltransferase [Modestobacter sp. URMC 112]